MIKNKIGIGMLILAILLIGVVFVASASADDSFETASESDVFGLPESEERLIPDFGSQTFNNLRTDPAILATKGQIPQFDTKEERLNWYEKLDKSKDLVKNDMEPYLYPNGSLIGYGWDINGYFEVTFYKGTKVTDSQINEIYTLIEKGASEASIQEIPVVFKKEDFLKEEVSGYTDRKRPLIGAIQIAVRKNGATKYATLGFPAKKSDGTEGYVTAKHFASSIDMAIHQPTYLSNNNNLIGDVDILGGHYADASFIEYSNVDPEIHVDNSVTEDVTGFLSTAPVNGWVGWTVNKSGRTTGVTSGTITGIGVTVNQDGWKYYNQVKAAYSSAEGDSGSPVYRISSGDLYIIGIHHGSLNGTAYFSPLSGVVSDLGVYPLKV